MKFEADIYTGSGSAKHFVQTINADTLATLKQKASRICNHYFSSYDQMHVVVYNSGGEIERETTFSRINKKQPNNTIIWGQWR